LPTTRPERRIAADDFTEKTGTGTKEMIRRCREGGLADGEFRQVGDQWVVTLWRDWLTPELHGRT
jgi:hypothetical protein